MEKALEAPVEEIEEKEQEESAFMRFNLQEDDDYEKVSAEMYKLECEKPMADDEIPFNDSVKISDTVSYPVLFTWVE